MAVDGTTDDTAGERPVQRGDRRRARRSIRMTSTIAVNRADGVTRAIVAPERRARASSPGRARSSTSAPTWSRSPARAPFQFVELGETGARQRRRLARLGACPVPQRAARGAELQPLRPADLVGAASRPSAARRRSTAIPNESRLIGPDARRSEDVLLTRFDAAALVPVLQGRQYLLVHVERASDILAGARAQARIPAAELVLVGATEGWRVADQIAAAGVPVIASARQRSAGLLRAAGRDPVECRPDARRRGRGRRSA